MIFSLPALIMGFLGSFHCVIMCTPLMLSVPLYSVNGIKILKERAVYQIGRILSYILIGLIFYSIGQNVFLINFQNYLSIAIGIFLIIYAASSIFNISFKAFSWTSKITFSLQAIFKRFIAQKNLLSRFLLGVSNGFLPCGLVYMAALTSVLQTNVNANISYMLWFGIGTLPAVMGFLAIGNVAYKKIGSQVLNWTPYFFSILGILFVIRGLELNIKFLSPILDYTVGEINNCGF